jgi:hypothetical protein
LDLKNAHPVKRVNYEPAKENGLETSISASIFNMMKKDEYRYNDMRIDLKCLTASDSLIKKSPFVRIEVTLRDNYGTVYDTFYLSRNEECMEFR